MIHIGNLKPWDLYSVLTQKYSWTSKNAREFADFLTPMLDFNTQRRADAYQCLQHKWIQTSRVESHAQNNNNDNNNNSKQDSPFATSTSSADNSDTSKREDSSSSASEKMLPQSSIEHSIPLTKPRYYSESIISSHVYDYDSDKRREARDGSGNKERHSESIDGHTKKSEKSSRKSIDLHEERRHSHRHH